LLRLLCTGVLASVLLLAKDVSALTEPILTVRLEDGTRTFTLQDLQDLGQVTFTTSTIWTEGEQIFTGVPLRKLVSALGVKEGELEAVAINDYSVTIPVEDALMDGPVVAYKQNGETLSVREKGPLWLVYPYDSNPDFQTEVVYSRSVWQLAEITIRD
jgi:hypothetical protein